MVHQMECKKNGCQANIDITGGKPMAICPQCRSLNCLKCQAVHDGMSCKVYMQNLQGSPNKVTEQDSASATAPTPAAAPEPSPRKSTPDPVAAPEELLVQCKVENCLGQAVVDKDADMFRCPVCKYFTCLKCVAVHESLTCVQYQSNKEGAPSPVYKPPKQPKEDQEESDDADDDDEEQKVGDDGEGQIVDCRHGKCTGFAYVFKTATVAQCQVCNHWTCVECKASHESQSCAAYKGIEEPPEDEHPEPQVQSSGWPTGARPKQPKEGRNGAANGNKDGLVSKLVGTVGNFFSGKNPTAEGVVAEYTRGRIQRGANHYGSEAARFGGYQDPYVYKQVQPGRAAEVDPLARPACGDPGRPVLLPLAQHLQAHHGTATLTGTCEACSCRKPDHVVEVCEHALCQKCILNAVKKSTTRGWVECPVNVRYVGRCSGSLSLDEAKQFVPKPDLKKIMMKNNWQPAKCFNKQCRGHTFETRKNAREYICPMCQLSNCVECQAIHNGMTCAEHIQKFVADVDAGRHEDPSEKKKRLEEQIKLHEQDCVSTTQEFECSICLVEVEPGEGIRLRNCLHEICKQCLADTAKNSPCAEVKCPSVFGDKPCEMPVLDNDIRACLSAEDYQALQEQGLREAENSSKEPSFHCKTPDCKGWCLYTHEADNFDCPVCGQRNCLSCEAIHKDMNCADYQSDLKRRAENDTAAKASLNFLEELLKSGQAMRCPQCRVVIIKRSGCDYMVCTSCKTKLCWATKGARWGPKGDGDTSGGCRCGVNGLKCHPTCITCH